MFTRIHIKEQAKKLRYIVFEKAHPTASKTNIHDASTEIIGSCRPKMTMKRCPRCNSRRIIVKITNRIQKTLHFRDHLWMCSFCGKKIKGQSLLLGKFED
ncbi:unnamed protein product [marine sediment metagenome]|uniref:Uncharacterized protein n=1 Tax=marine sediment metagenome TaxID=412755 RepID=X0TJ75_9ZZZZ